VGDSVFYRERCSIVGFREVLSAKVGGNSDRRKVSRTEQTSKRTTTSSRMPVASRVLWTGSTFHREMSRQWLNCRRGRDPMSRNTIRSDSEILRSEGSTPQGEYGVNSKQHDTRQHELVTCLG